MTACKRLRDLRTAGLPFIFFGVVAPNVFATIGMFVAHGYSMSLGQPFDMGTYVLFAVLCGAASYIAVPAIQRLAIPEASPTLPLAASLGLDVFVQRDDRHSGVHRDRQGDHAEFPGRLTR